MAVQDRKVLLHQCRDLGSGHIPVFTVYVALSVCHNRRGQITSWRKQKAEGRMLSPAGLVGFSAGRRLQKLSSAPRALARLQLIGKNATSINPVYIHSFLFIFSISLVIWSGLSRTAVTLGSMVSTLSNGKQP